MKNLITVLLCGFGHGGTNIGWNILQSHPDFVAPPYETGEIFRDSPTLRLLNTGKCYKYLPFSKMMIDRILFRYKMRSLSHPDNRYRSEGVLYSKDQMGQSVLCLKSVNNDILLTDILTHVYPNLYFIGLTRNGLSLAEGYIRRGRTVKEAGQMYCWLANQMKKFSVLIDRFKIIKLEDVLAKPFETAEELFTFTEVHPRQLDKLRLKSKKVINNNGAHNVVFGSEHRKYWFTRETISEILVTDIDNKQMTRLTDQQIEEFHREAHTALRYFGYI